MILFKILRERFSAIQSFRRVCKFVSIFTEGESYPLYHLKIRYECEITRENFLWMVLSDKT